MSAAALALCLAYLSLVFGVRAVVQRRSTGASGWVSGGGATAMERRANAIFLAGWALVVAGPALGAVGAVRPLASAGVVAPAGIVLIALAAPLAVWAQAVMGGAWKTGIDPAGAPTALVTGGPFAAVRNPVYTSMCLVALGVALMVPGVVTGAGFLVLVLALEVQTRRVEEPFLAARHGDAYAHYLRSAGRFAPLVGRSR